MIGLRATLLALLVLLAGVVTPTPRAPTARAAS
jgi:hypothetical protein